MMTMTDGMYDSSVRPAGDFGGIFEENSNTCYFYLYNKSKSGEKFLDHIHILSGRPDFTQEDISIKWDISWQRVGLFIRGNMWAMFDCTTGEKFGGNYKYGRLPDLPPMDVLAS